MPTYDYHCKACGARHEIFHSMAVAAKRKCPACGALKLERLVGTGAGFIFKGSGFYQTDYRSESYKAGEKADGAPTSGTSGSGTSSSSAPSSDAGTCAKPECGTSGCAAD